MGDAYTMRGEIRNAYNVSAGKPERKRLQANIKFGLRKTDDKYVDWIQVIQDRFQWRAFGSIGLDIWFHKRREMS